MPVIQSRRASSASSGARLAWTMSQNALVFGGAAFGSKVEMSSASLVCRKRIFFVVAALARKNPLSAVFDWMVAVGVQVLVGRSVGWMQQRWCARRPPPI
jgi:hypothetical protein